MSTPALSRSVVVIGAGAGGLVAARELRNEGHRVTIIEQQEDIGGVWRYQPDVEDDPLGVRPTHRLHGSLYQSLRTNLPREIMGFRDFPFLPSHMASSVDDRRFPRHKEVLLYLSCFADRFDLRNLCTFNCKVKSISREGDDTESRWKVETEPSFVNGCPSAASSSTTVECDAVCVANGHYSSPYVPDLLGGNSFPTSRQIHAHNYRFSDPYRGRSVLVVGASNSGDDISREIAQVARTVFVSCRGAKEGGDKGGKVIRCGEVVKLSESGMAELEDGGQLGPFDSVIWCTGYCYEFPFIKDTHSIGLNLVEGKRVDPLYCSMFLPHIGPRLSFIGIPWKVVPFPQFEIQARMLARALSGRIQLPSESEMMKHVRGFFEGLEIEGTPLRYTHMQGLQQWEYNDSLADMSCSPDLLTPEWVKRFYSECSDLKKRDPDSYRDAAFLEDSDEDRLILEQAYHDLRNRHQL